MAWLFVRLKLRLVAGSMAGDPERRWGFVFSAIFAGLFAVAGFGLLASVRTASPDLAAEIVILAFAGLFVVWVCLPVFGVGIDETLDPARLALFPIPARRLAIGLFAASAAGVWPLASLIVAFGALAGLADGPVDVLTRTLAVLLMFVLCVTASRALTTALARALRSRRGKDLVFLAAFLSLLLFQVPSIVMYSDVSVSDPEQAVSDAAGVLRWTPPGMAAHAGLLDLACVTLVILLLGWFWMNRLARILDTADTSTQIATVAGGRGLVTRLLPEGPVRAIVAKDLKYARRDPRLRVGYVMAPTMAIVVTFWLYDSGGGLLQAVLPAVAAAAMLGIQSANCFGNDGPALWMNSALHATDAGVRRDLAARQLAVTVIGTPLVAVFAIAGAVITGRPAYAIVAMLTAAAAFGTSLGISAVTSVRNPYTMPERTNSLSMAAPGQGGIAAATALGALAGTALLALPALLPVLLGYAWLSVLGVPYGVIAAWLGRRIGAQGSAARFPAILAAVSRAV